MKQLKRRTIFVLVFTLLLAAGMVLFCALYLIRGRAWASSPVNMSAYSSGRLSSGVLYDRDGELLYDCETQQYSESWRTRISTLHLVGDAQGNIATGGKKLFARQLVSYNPITGMSSSGNKVYLSVDADLNAAAYGALDGRSGTVAVYNYKTGEILCMVSTPSYDPIDDAEVEAVANGDSSYAGAYMNRLISSTYTPGSTFKVITSAAAIEEMGDALADFSFECTGSYEINGEQVTCPSVHGVLDFEGALAHSCNCAYAYLALELGGDTLREYAEQAGLLDSLSINGYDTAVGKFDVAEPDSLNLGWSGVGQYHDLVCPANMMALMGCIANGGSAAAPRLLHRVTSQIGLPTGQVRSSNVSIGWDGATCDRLAEMMRNNVTSVYGQGKFGDLPVCAKSGTAEVGSSVDPHAWFVGFIDDDTHPYAFVVIVENGGWGSSTAGSIAATVLSAACSEETE